MEVAKLKTKIKSMLQELKPANRKLALALLTVSIVGGSVVGAFVMGQPVSSHQVICPSGSTGTGYSYGYGFYPIATGGSGYGYGYSGCSFTPTIAAITPTSGPESGGTTVTITGTNLMAVQNLNAVFPTVDFGTNNPATDVSCSSSTSCTAVSPVGPTGGGPVSLTVTTPGGTSNAINFDYILSVGYTPLTPYRICDTRPAAVSGLNDQCTGKTLGFRQSMPIQVAGYTGNAPSGAVTVPANASAVVLNVTEASATMSGYLTVYPAGVTRPTASSLNFLATSGSVSNLVQLSLGSTSTCAGCVDVFNFRGSTNIVVDVEGYFGPISSPGEGSFVPLTPYRICDTRSTSVSGLNDQCSGKTLAPKQSLTVQVGGYQGTAASLSDAVPSSASAVALNVTEASATLSGYLTVYPASATSPPTASNLNFLANEVVPNGAITELSSSGAINIYNFRGTTDVIVDVVGYFTSPSSSPTGSAFYGTTPYRICDTRSSTLSGLVDQCTGETIAQGKTLNVQVSNYSGTASSVSQVVPANATAVVLNVTEATANAHSFLTIWPQGVAQPASSNLNFTPTTGPRPNFVTVPLSSLGQISIYNHYGDTDVIVDVVGWYS